MSPSKPATPKARRSTSNAGPDARLSPYEMLKKAILSGELAAGQALVETALAEWCQVSRTPIREALRRLEQDGLVHRTDRGLAVRERSPEEILDIYEVRIVLEATVGRIAAERRTEHDVWLLRRLLARGEAVAPGDEDGMVEANTLFHRAMWRASHNESLLDLLERLDLHLSRYPGTTLLSPGRWAQACREHGLLVDAIQNREGEVAYDLVLKHFTEARDIRLSLYAEDSLSV